MVTDKDYLSKYAKRYKAGKYVLIISRFRMINKKKKVVSEKLFFTTVKERNKQIIYIARHFPDIIGMFDEIDENYDVKHRTAKGKENK